MTQRKEIEEKIQELRLQIEQLEKESSKADKTCTPWAIVDLNKDAFSIHSYLDGEFVDGHRNDTNDLNAFKKQSTAEGFANAFHVMIALRQCEGAGEYDCAGGGFTINNDGCLAHYYGGSYFSLFPPFPTKALAVAAAEKLGRDRIVAAYKFLATGELS